MKKTVCLLLLLTIFISLVGCDYDAGAPKNAGEMTIVVRDANGTPVPGTRVAILEGTRVLATLTADADGRIKTNMLFGAYTLKIDFLPDKYEIVYDNIHFDFSEKNHTYTILVDNVMADGSEKKPYIIDGNTTISLGAGKSAYYLIKPDGDKNTLYIPNAENLVIKIDGVEVHHNFRGNISYTADGETLVVITNTGDKIDAPAELVLEGEYTAPGENPNELPLDPLV
jgi:hypothetical protein